MDSGFSPPANRVVNASPLTGATIVIPQDSIGTTLYLTPAGTIAALTVTLPADAVSRLGETIRLMTRQTITALTMNGAASIVNPVTTMNAGESFAFQKVAADTWMRI